jgi:hypothetical protein
MIKPHQLKVVSFIMQPTRGFGATQMEVTSWTSRENPPGPQPANPPPGTAAPGIRIAFDDSSPQYLSGENE